VLLASLPAAPREALLALYARQPQSGDDGCVHPIDATTRIAIEEGLELMRLVTQVGAQAVLEVGLAYGFSAQFLLAALEQQGGGQLVAIDPFQGSDWHGIGCRLAEASVAASPAGRLRFRWLGERSDHALPQLERSGERFGLIFVDGYHRFDDVLIDLTLAARLCRPGGVIVLHDLWLPAVRAVVAFVEANRPDLQRQSCSCRNLAVFVCCDSDRRNWDHFVPFASMGEPWLDEA
jgi:predicted O-methyltransferase YrrM